MVTEKKMTGPPGKKEFQEKRGEKQEGPRGDMN